MVPLNDYSAPRLVKSKGPLSRPQEMTRSGWIRMTVWRYCQPPLPPRAGTRRRTAPTSGRTLLALTIFEMFDTMAGPEGDLFDAVPVITGIATTVLGANA